ncbi:unnamed protein product [Urochloa decumbens]|uniref:Uncharacterized protein n=1 Tax=Urochloa decumbens TaxID=240449 RepID=A0ABC9A1V3_9POAL
MAMSALSTSALSSLEAMLLSLMRGSGGGGGGGDGDTPLDDTLASPPPPPLPARPTARVRPPSRRRARPAAVPHTLSPSSPTPSSSTSTSKEQEDATSSSTTEDVSLVVEELERKAEEVEARLRHKEEENAALKRRMESYHIRWLEYEIRIKSLEEAFHEKMAALQLAQDAAARRAEETACDRREHSESASVSDEPPPPPVRLWHGRDRMSVGRRSAVSRLGSEFRRQSHTLDRGAAALVVAEAPAAGAATGGFDSVADLKKLKAQFRAWTKDYKARLRKAKAELGRDRRRQGSCWI